MAVQFKVPKSPTKSIEAMEDFRGADFTNASSNIDNRRSPNCQNLIRDVPGKVRKSLGWHTIATYNENDEKKAINGVFYLVEDDTPIVHCGNKLYYGDTLIYSSMNDAISSAYLFGETLYIMDGTNYLMYSQTRSGDVITHHVDDVCSKAYIPTVTISKNPDGGGTSYEDLNLLQAGFTEQFIVDSAHSTAKIFQLSFKPLDATTVKAQILNAQGEWVDKTESTDFTVDRTNGKVTFNTAPGTTPLTGEDNVKITAYRTVSGYADKIKKCSVGILYGIKGGKDRLFVSGNPDYINYDWHSEQYNLTYFCDTSYARLGSDTSKIVGYTIIANSLATHKDEVEREQNIIMRAGQVDKDNKEVFPITNAIQGAGAIAKHSFGYMQTEPLFPTREGVFAVTAQDVTGEKYSQSRSFYINGRLLEEPNLENAYCCVFNDNYWICINNVAYILDGLQPNVTVKDAPYSTRQYAGFYRTNIPANIMWTRKHELYFGTHDGRLCKFYTDKESPDSYNDDGEPIVSIWETADIDGQLFYKNKTLRYVAVRVDSAVRTSLRLDVYDKGFWEFVKYDDEFAGYLDFSEIDFSRFTFSCDTTQQIFRTKLRVKKVDKFRLRITNDALNEPFGINNIAMEYVENGYYKG